MDAFDLAMRRLRAEQVAPPPRPAVPRPGDIDYSEEACAARAQVLVQESEAWEKRNPGRSGLHRRQRATEVVTA